LPPRKGENPGIPPPIPMLVENIVEPPPGAVVEPSEGLGASWNENVVAVEGKADVGGNVDNVKPVEDVDVDDNDDKPEFDVKGRFGVAFIGKVDAFGAGAGAGAGSEE